MNPLCNECGEEVRLMRDGDGYARWWCSKHGFRKTRQLNFVIEEYLK